MGYCSKSHAEVAARGGKDMAKNLRNLNIAHLSGILYSALALGFGVTSLNIWLTRKLYNAQNKENARNNNALNTQAQPSFAHYVGNKPEIFKASAFEKFVKK